MKNKSREQELEQVISNLLRVSLKPINLVGQLNNILRILTNISWLSLEQKGAIFLIGSENSLVMVAHRELSQKILETCEEVKIGECLCGLAAQQKRILFKNCIDEEHTIQYEGMQDHGHYNIPLLNNNDLLGVIALYVPHGYRPEEYEMAFIEMIGDVISSIITKNILDERAKVSKYELEASQSEVIDRLLSVSEFRDNDTGKHIKRMTKYSMVIVKHAGLSQGELRLLELGAPMHDIGKIGIPDSILLNSGRLTDAEFNLMKEHTVIGSKILTGQTEYLKVASEIALSHHEKWDGSGYPYGKKGSEISLYGRICAIADVFDAFTTKRPYKEAWPLKKAFEYIQGQSGQHFDPELSKIFHSSKEEIRRFHVIYGDDIISQPNKLILPQQNNIAGRVNWSSDLEIGIDVIDEHHKYLVGLINEIDHSILQRNEVSDVITAITKMKDYANIHFAEEERFMKKCRYPFLNEHIEHHRYFISKYESYQQILKKHCLTIGIEIVRFLKTWLVCHIKKEDSKIREWLKSNEIIV